MLQDRTSNAYLDCFDHKDEQYLESSFRGLERACREYHQCHAAICILPRTGVTMYRTVLDQILTIPLHTAAIAIPESLKLATRVTMYTTD